MHVIDRRQLLCGTASVFGLAALPQFARAATRALKPPVARIANVKDVYFGETINDPYRWMENDKDPEWRPFLKGQNDYARSVLDALPGREAFLKRIAQLSGDTVSTTRVQRAGNRLFYQQRPLVVRIRRMVPAQPAKGSGLRPFYG